MKPKNRIQRLIDQVKNVFGDDIELIRDDVNRDLEDDENVLPSRRRAFAEREEDLERARLNNARKNDQVNHAWDQARDHYERIYGWQPGKDLGVWRAFLERPLTEFSDPDLNASIARFRDAVHEMEHPRPRVLP